MKLNFPAYIYTLYYITTACRLNILLLLPLF